MWTSAREAKPKKFTTERKMRNTGKKILLIIIKVDELMKSRHSGLPVPDVWVSGIGCFF